MANGIMVIIFKIVSVFVIVKLMKNSQIRGSFSLRPNLCSVLSLSLVIAQEYLCFRALNSVFWGFWSLWSSFWIWNLGFWLLGGVIMRLNGEISCWNEEQRENESGALVSPPKLVVGYALTSKKVKSFLQPKLEGLAR